MPTFTGSSQVVPRPHPDTLTTVVSATGDGSRGWYFHGITDTRGVVGFVPTAACETSAPATQTATAVGTPPPVAARARNKYFDLLRALALMRVILYHSLGLTWL